MEVSFIGEGKAEYPEKTTDLSQVTHRLPDLMRINGRFSHKMMLAMNLSQ
jgi:hypothetical protein